MTPKLQRPVHNAVAWLAIAAVFTPSFLAINVALAQTAETGIFATASSTGQPYSVQPYPEKPYPGQPPMPIQFASGTRPMMPPVEGQDFQPPMPGKEMPGQPGIPNQPSFECPAGMICSGQRQRNEMERQRMEQEQMRGMKQQLGGFVRGMKMAQTQVERLKKQGVTPPEEMVEALKNVEVIAAKIKNIQSPEEMESLQGEIQDTVSVVEEWMPKMPMLFELPRVIKQAEKEMVKLNKAYKNDERRARIKKMNLTEELKEFRAAIDQHQTLLDEAKALAKSDPEEAVEKIHDEFYPELDDVWQHEEVLQIALNFQKGIAKMNNEIKNGDRLIKKLKAQKNDTVELEAALAQMKTQFATVKKIYNTKPLKSADLIEAADEMMSTAQEFANLAEDLTGDAEYEPTLKTKAVEIDMPDIFRGMNATENIMNKTK